MERHLNSPQTGKPLKRGNPVPSCGDKLQKGVETRREAQQMALGPNCGVVAGAVPVSLNGRLGSALAAAQSKRDGIVHASRERENKNSCSAATFSDVKLAVNCHREVALLSGRPTRGGGSSFGAARRCSFAFGQYVATAARAVRGCRKEAHHEQSVPRRWPTAKPLRAWHPERTREDAKRVAGRPQSRRWRAP